MLAVGDLVRIVGLFASLNENGLTVAQIQHVALDGGLSDTSTGRVQYILSGGAAEGMAFSEEFIEAL